MKLKITIILAISVMLSIIPHFTFTQDIIWSKAYGLPTHDSGQSIAKTNSGGYIFAGYSQSMGDDVSDSEKVDFRVIMVDSTGNLLWSKNYGGSRIDICLEIKKVPSEDSFVMVGYTQSNDGDIKDNNGGRDIWVLKIDGQGNIIWSNNFGGSYNEYASSFEFTYDNGIIVAGSSRSADGDVGGNYNTIDMSPDYWVVRLDYEGKIMWEQNYGGNSLDRQAQIKSTLDGGFIIAGMSESITDDVSNNYGECDYWVIKIDSLGNLIWEKNFGGEDDDILPNIECTRDTGYLVAGTSRSTMGDISDNKGRYDFWICKLGSTGDLIWEKSYGGSRDDILYGITPLSNGNYVLFGLSYSSNGDLNNNYGYSDYWLIIIDSLGNKVWSRNYGGSLAESAYDVIETDNSELLVLGTTSSTDIDVPLSGVILSRFWALLIGQGINTSVEEFSNHGISVYPNPAVDFLYIDSESQLERMNYEVNDMLGRTVLMGSIPTKKINISVLSPGIYTLNINHIQSDGPLYSGCFIKK